MPPVCPFLYIGPLSSLCQLLLYNTIGIAAAIVESPDLILLDEPFNALDESGIKEIRDLLRELRQKGKLIVLTCHDRQQMESLADEIIAMREGRIVNVDKNCHEEV